MADFDGYLVIALPDKMTEWRDEIVTGHTGDEARKAIAPLLDADPGDFDGYLVIALPNKPIPGRSNIIAATNLDPGQAHRLAAEWLREAQEHGH
jgi:hypothetical protein